MIGFTFSYGFAGEGPKKPVPEIMPPKRDGDRTGVGPEIPVLPRGPESERPGGGPEVSPVAPVEVPEMPGGIETEVPARELH